MRAIVMILALHNRNNNPTMNISLNSSLKPWTFFKKLIYRGSIRGYRDTGYSSKKLAGYWTFTRYSGILNITVGDTNHWNWRGTEYFGQKLMKCGILRPHPPNGASIQPAKEKKNSGLKRNDNKTLTVFNLPWSPYICHQGQDTVPLSGGQHMQESPYDFLCQVCHSARVQIGGSQLSENFPC